LNKKILFLTLRVFSAAGGIERVCRVAGKALCELNDAPEANVKIYSMYGNTTDINTEYFPAEVFRGFSIKKIEFVIASVQQGRKTDVVILSHINLLFVGFLIKIFSPKTKVLLFAHGIEVWKTFSGWKKYMFRHVDRILSVSHFTNEKMIALNQFDADKFIILNNCLDPFLPKPSSTTAKDQKLSSKYNLTENDFVLMTLSRLSEIDRYKGYDKVIDSMQHLIKQYPNLKYLLVGKYEAAEKKRLTNFIQERGLEKYVIITGFVPDDELAAYYNLADVFIMPSKKEGFGIAFIEALYYGKPVIAGNKDGSVDALLNGKLGLLVNPDNNEEIAGAIKKMINNRQLYLPDHNLLMQYFGYEVYKNNLEQIIGSV
jgi:phosphatidylinositol alpha-1,6-mannosyltransferase